LYADLREPGSVPTFVHGLKRAGPFLIITFTYS
jgi:hypothetical protein